MPMQPRFPLQDLRSTVSDGAAGPIESVEDEDESKRKNITNVLLSRARDAIHVKLFILNMPAQSVCHTTQVATVSRRWCIATQ